MDKKKASVQRIDRITASLATSLSGFDHDSQHGYELSSSFASSEKRRLMGEWVVYNHNIDGIDFIQNFIATTLRGIELQDSNYQSSYHFMDGICIRKTTIVGILQLPDSRPFYQFRMSMALQWQLEPQTLLIRPVLGYQYASLDDQAAAVKELGASGELLRVTYHFDNDELVVSDQGDEKRLRKVT